MSTNLFFGIMVLFFCAHDQLYAACVAKPIVISIGHTCATAIMIKDFGLHYRSYPFDWLITDLNGIINGINSDFADIMDVYYLKDIGECSSTIDPIPGRMWHSLYNFFSIHDFTVKLNSPQIGLQLASVKERFIRRTDRLMRVMESDAKVVLIRWNNCHDAGIGVTKETYIQLSNLLNARYPNNNIMIIAVDQRDEYVQNWELDTIKNYYMPYHPTSSKAHHLWIPILREHNLIP